MFYREVLLAPRPTPKLEDHPSSAVHDCLFNLFAATLHIAGRSSIRNLRTHHAVVTGTHCTWDIRGCVMQFWPPDDEHMCSKHVEAWNKTYCETNFCASTWLNTEINILRCTVSKTSKKMCNFGFTFSQSNAKKTIFIGVEMWLCVIV